MTHETLCVDHCFVLIEIGALEETIRRLDAAGLVESSRRSHRGLGTSNIFYCFDNAFLEILWIEDPQLAATSALARELLKRTAGGATSASRYGIGLRDCRRASLPFATWEFLPPDTAGLPHPIHIAQSSQDPRQPFLFRAQRLLRPDAWTDGSAGDRQRANGLSEIERVSYAPLHDAPTVDLETLDSLGLVRWNRERRGPALQLTIAATGARSREFDLATFQWLEVTT